MKHTTKGFTLIEVMVAVSIIAILSAIVYANFGDARRAANDDVRKSSLKELQLAVELYKAQNGSYPPDSGSNPLDVLVPDFIASVPTDPSGTAFEYNAYGTNNTAYKILTNEVQVNTVKSYTDEFARCPYGCSNSVCPNSVSSSDFPSNTYAVYSVGAECE